MRTFALTLSMALAALTLAGVAPRLATSTEIEETPLTDTPADVAASEGSGPGAKVEESLERAGEALSGEGE